MTPQEYESKYKVAREMLKNQAKLATPRGWTIEISAACVHISRSEGRGERGKKVNVGRIGLVTPLNSGEDVPLALTYDLILGLMELTAQEALATLVWQYAQGLSAAGVSAFKLPQLRWEMERGIDLINYALPPIKGGDPESVTFECSTADFRIVEQGPDLLTIVPSHHHNARVQAAAFYAELAKMPAEQLPRLKMADVRAALERAGVLCHCYYAHNL